MSLWGLASFSKLQGTKDDDWADRASHLYTVVLLCIFVVLVSSAQYVGDPIQCWCPAEFTTAYVAYTKNICWISNTYYIPHETMIPKEIYKREKAQITYYQWVPIIFLFMALLFKTPNMLWRMAHSYSGINMAKVIAMAETTQTCSSTEERDEKLEHLARYLDRWLEAYRHYNHSLGVRIRQKLSGIFCFFLSKRDGSFLMGFYLFVKLLYCINTGERKLALSIFCFFLSKRDGSFLMGFYLFVKLLYCINTVCQFFLLNSFLAMEYNLYGFEVLDRLRRGLEATHNSRFPRVTLCDFLIRQMTNVQRYTIQCVLPINLFNEKIFIVLWFWLFLVAVVAWSNFTHWMYWTLAKENRVRYVKKYLKLSDVLNTSADRRLCRKFAHDYLREDGVFVLRVVACNSSELALKDLVVQLWKIFKTNYVSPPALPDAPPLLGGMNGVDMELEDKTDLTDIPL